MKLERESGGHRNAEGLLVLPRAGLSITEQIHAQELSLPISPVMTGEEVSELIGVVNEARLMVCMD